jgi:hypothetical protein
MEQKVVYAFDLGLLERLFDELLEVLERFFVVKRRLGLNVDSVALPTFERAADCDLAVSGVIPVVTVEKVDSAFKSPADQRHGL